MMMLFLKFYKIKDFNFKFSKLVRTKFNNSTIKENTLYFFSNYLIWLGEKELGNGKSDKNTELEFRKNENRLILKASWVPPFVNER